MKLVLIEDNADLALKMRALLEFRGYCATRTGSADLNGIDLLKPARATLPIAER